MWSLSEYVTCILVWMVGCVTCIPVRMAGCATCIPLWMGERVTCIPTWSLCGCATCVLAWMAGCVNCIPALSLCGCATYIPLWTGGHATCIPMWSLGGTGDRGHGDSIQELTVPSKGPRPPCPAPGFLWGEEEEAGHMGARARPRPHLRSGGRVWPSLSIRHGNVHIS